MPDHKTVTIVFELPDVKKEDVLAAYPGWEPEVDQMLSVCTIILTFQGPLSFMSFTVS